MGSEGVDSSRHSEPNSTRGDRSVTMQNELGPQEQLLELKSQLIHKKS